MQSSVCVNGFTSLPLLVGQSIHSNLQLGENVFHPLSFEQVQKLETKWTWLLHLQNLNTVLVLALHFLLTTFLRAFIQYKLLFPLSLGTYHLSERYCRPDWPVVKCQTEMFPALQVSKVCVGCA